MNYQTREISLLGQSYLRHVDVVEIKGDRMTLRFVKPR